MDRYVPVSTLHYLSGYGVTTLVCFVNIREDFRGRLTGSLSHAQIPLPTSLRGSRAPPGVLCIARTTSSTEAA